MIDLLEALAFLGWSYKRSATRIAHAYGLEF